MALPFRFSIVAEAKAQVGRVTPVIGFSKI